MQKIIDNFTKEEKKAFDKMNEKDRDAFLMQKKATMPQDISAEFQSMDDIAGEEDDYPIFGVATKTNPLGMKKGDTVVAHLLGTVPMYSAEQKENWDSFTYTNKDGDTKKYWESYHFRFKDAEGKVFGMFGSSGLWPLKKVLTADTDPEIKINPIVKIGYMGKVVGKEKLEKEYGIKITSGDEAHIFDFKFQKGTTIKKMEKGVLNYLKRPVPVESKGNQDERLVSLNNWDSQEKKRRALAAATATKTLGQQEGSQLQQ